MKDPASIIQLQERIDHATGFVQTQQIGGKRINEDDAFKNAVIRASSASSQGGGEDEEEDY